MNKPKVQEDIVPAEGGSPAANPEGHTPMGIPSEIIEGDPTADPTGDRFATEVAPLRIEKDGRQNGQRRLNLLKRTSKPTRSRGGRVRPCLPDPLSRPLPSVIAIRTATMNQETMKARISEGSGFIAALDQSGGSTPGALRLYGIPDNAYNGDGEMFRLMHEMRVRIMTAPAFTGDKILAAILFEGTMDGQAQGRPVPAFLSEERGVIPFVKVDKGLEAERDGVSMMKPMPEFDALLTRATALGVFGTKMRSVINLPSKPGIAAIVKQQFEVAVRIAKHGLMPIIEPEVSIRSPDKAAAEAILLDELAKGLDTLPDGTQVMLKLTIPDVPDLYSGLKTHERVMRIVALSGGYTRADACRRLAANHGMIASFSRALIDDLRKSMSDAEFDAELEKTVDEIYTASTVKT